MMDTTLPKTKVGYLPNASRPADQGPYDDAEQTGDQIDRRKVRDVDAEIVHGVGAAERHQHVAAGRQQRRYRESQPIAWLCDRRDQMPEGVFVLLQQEMAVHRLHQEQHSGHPGDRQADQRAERDVPVPMV